MVLWIFQFGIIFMSRVPPYTDTAWDEMRKLRSNKDITGQNYDNQTFSTERRNMQISFRDIQLSMS